VDSNQQVFDEAASTYTDMAMMPAERAVLRRLTSRIPELDMLDLGVGTGRTGWTYAPLTRRYVGVDYSPRMLEAAKQRLGAEDGVELLLRDARNISEIEGKFDFILFSFNAIDALSPEGRLQVFDQVRSKLRPDGLFQFSSHSLGALPFDTRRPLSTRFGESRAYRLYAMYAGVVYRKRIRAINRAIDLEAARRRGWDLIPSMAHNFRIRDYYIDPEFQVKQLRDHRLEVVAVFDTEGNEVTLPHPSRAPWFDYLCTPI
jgi:SAM-dependent methyltransferase